jgi:hypothetical protein
MERRSSIVLSGRCSKAAVGCFLGGPSDGGPSFFDDIGYQVSGCCGFGVGGFFRGVGGAFEVQFVTIQVTYRGHPHGVANEGCARGEAAGDELSVEGESVAALEADGDAMAESLTGEGGVWAELLKHDGGAFELEPAPADFAVDDPLFGAGESEAFDVEAEGGFHVGDHEEGDGLLDVGFFSDRWLFVVGCWLRVHFGGSSMNWCCLYRRGRGDD